jgi:hypothetical protein
VLINGRLVEGWSVGDAPDPDGDDELFDGDDPAGTADDGAVPVLPAWAAASFPLEAEKTEFKLRCATGATDLTTLAAVVGIRKAKARKPVMTTVGIRSSFFIGSFRILLSSPRAWAAPTQMI